MKQETELIQRSSMRQEVANMNETLAQMQRSLRVHFVKSLPRTSIQKGELGRYAELTLPVQFVQENYHKIEEWVVLRTQLSSGKSSRPWLVRLRVHKTAATVRIGLGWHSFVVGNHLKEGDSVIFLLKEDCRSEFEVHLFRGPQGSPYFPDEGEYSPSDEEDEQDHVSVESEEETYSPSLGHREVERNKADINHFRNGKAAPFPNIKTLDKARRYPGFCKKLTASSITNSNGDNNGGIFVFPRSFVKTHGNQLHGYVQLQGIHEYSPTYLLSFYRSPQHCLWVSFVPSEWSRFVKENGLKSGHELQFSLVDESYFVVRKV